MPLVRRLAVLAFAAAAALAACKKEYYTGPTGPIDPATETFGSNLRSLGVDVTAMEKRPTGLYVRDRTAGNGDVVTTGDSIAVRYTGYFTDGRAFDSNVNFEEPLDLRLGRGRVIAGWEQGIPGMRVGGKRLLIIPSALAYGEAGRQGIPPYANLVFDIELITKY